jgi:hypothetical protein
VPPSAGTAASRMTSWRSSAGVTTSRAFKHVGGARPFERQTRFVLGSPAPGQVGVLQEHHGKCHLSGDSTTPSREMKKYDLIFRISCLPLLDGPVADAR